MCVVVSLHKHEIDKVCIHIVCFNKKENKNIKLNSKPMISYIIVFIVNYLGLKKFKTTYLIFCHVLDFV